MSTSPTPYTPPNVLEWNHLACDAIYFTKMPPTVASRALAIVQTAIYDAWSCYMIGKELSTTTGDRFQRPERECTKENREKAIAHAAYQALVELFQEKLDKLPEDKSAMLQNAMKKMGYDPLNTSEDPTKPEGVGNISAWMLLEARRGDGSNQTGNRGSEPYSDYTGYAPVNPPFPQKTKDLSKWQPQLAEPGKKPQKFLTPHWGCVRPFALKHGGQFRPPAPAERGTARWSKQFKEIIQISACLNDEQKISAEVWAGMHEDQFFENPSECYTDYWTVPPAMLCRMLHEIIIKNEMRTSYAVMLLFAATNALMDSGIAAWDAKVYFDYARPVSVIHEEMDEVTFDAWGGPCQSTVPMEGEGWKPYLIQTPPFAEYVSGHSTFSAAVAEIVKCFCGNNQYGGEITVKAKKSKIEPDCAPKKDVTLSWRDLTAAADDAGMSRRYGGIHFEDGDIQGRELGKKVARAVWAKVCDYFNGEAV